MPFPYESSKEPVRTRRSKDKDSRSTTSSSSKRSKHTSGSSGRSAPHTDRTAPLSLYTQQNLTLDQLPALPESGTTSPGSATSPILRASSVTSQPANPPTPILQHHTPAALRQYLETDDVETPRSEIPPPPKPEVDSQSVRDITPQDQRRSSSKPLDSHTATPQAASTQGYLPPSRDHSVSPSFFGQPLERFRSNSSRTSTSARNETPSYSASSPPPQSASPSVKLSTGPGSPHPGQHQFSPPSAYTTSPSPFAPAIPHHPRSSDEAYYPSSHVGPQYYQMTRPGGYVDLQSLPPQTFQAYANNLPSNHPQSYFYHLHRQPPGGSSSPSSRMSVPGEFPMAPQAQGTPISDTPGPARSSNEDDASDLLQRISGALPDINALLNRYQETTGQLGDRELRLQETEAQRIEAVRHRDHQISQLNNDLKEVKEKHGVECSKLRLELGNMEEKHKELKETLTTEQKLKEELQASHQALTTKLEETQKEKETVQLEFAARYDALREENQHQTRYTEEELQAKVNEVDKLHAAEKDALKASHLRQLNEQEAQHQSAAQESKRRLGLERKLRDESRSRHINKETELSKDHHDLEKRLEEAHVESAQSTAHHQSQIKQLQGEKETVRREHEMLIVDKTRMAEDERMKLCQEIERLMAERDSERAANAKKLEGLKEKIAGLERFADAWGEVTDLKSKGDAYYLNEFVDLDDKISNLSADLINNSPVPFQLPHNIRTSIPPNIPPFFGDTTAARALRVAYVEHLISDIITRRIFKPFLFVLERRQVAMDNIFQEWAEGLKQKSTKREAVWRQRTLHAAYTAPSAKQSINRIARSIVVEIMEAVKHFTRQSQWQSMTIHTREIVKIAAEAWRYARLELGLITASMSGEDRARSPEIGPTPSFAMDPKTSGAGEILLLRFPLIKRYPSPSDLNLESDKIDQGCTYTHGRALYSNDPNVLACRMGGERHSSMLKQSRKAPTANRPQSSAQDYRGVAALKPRTLTTQVNNASPEIPQSSPSHRRLYDENTRQSASRDLHESRVNSPLDGFSRPEQATPSSRNSSNQNGVFSAPERHYPDRKVTSSPVSPDQEIPSPQEACSTDRATPSPEGAGENDRASLSAENDTTEDWHDVGRDTRTPTPVQDHQRSNTKAPHVEAEEDTEEGEVARSGESETPSEQAMGSAPASSQHSHRSPSPTVDVPDWGNRGDEIPGSGSRQDEW